MYMSVFMCADAFGGQKVASDSMKWELQVVMSCPLWVLGTEPRTITQREDLKH